MYSILIELLSQFWQVLSDMSPYLLFGFFVAGVLSVVISEKMVERHLGGRGLIPVVKASLLGVPLPLCSCGVIPVAATLRKHGASRGATTSFLISTPQTGVDSIMVTYGLLGLVFAIFRPIAAFISGILGGALVSIAEPHDEPSTKNDNGSASQGKVGVYRKIILALKYGFITLPKDIARALILGVVIAGFIAALTPDDFFAAKMGGGVLAIVVMMVVGLPLYVCATASVPIAAVLIAKGVSPGAAFAFLTTGPATNAATIVTVWKIMGRKTALIYLATVAFTAFGGGLLLDYVFSVSEIPPVTHVHDMMPGSVQTASAVVLVVLLVLSFFDLSRKPAASAALANVETLRLRISGMTCNHCAETVREALAACSGVSSVQVDLKNGFAEIQGNSFNGDILRSTVEKKGFRVE